MLASIRACTRSLPGFCCEQAEKTEDIKVTTLLDILGRADEEKLPLFYKLLEESGHKDVTQKLKRNGQQQEHTLLHYCILLM